MRFKRKYFWATIPLLILAIWACFSVLWNTNVGAIIFLCVVGAIIGFVALLWNLRFLYSVHTYEETVKEAKRNEYTVEECEDILKFENKYFRSAQHFQDTQRFIDYVGADFNVGHISREEYLCLIKLALDTLERDESVSVEW